MKSKDQIISDSNVNYEEGKHIRGSIKYWEPKRLLFNILVVISMLLVFIYYIDGVRAYGKRLIFELVIPYLIIGNLIYSISWIVEYSLLKRKWIKTDMIRLIREIVYTVGIITSIGITIFLFGDILYWHDWHSRN